MCLVEIIILAPLQQPEFETQMFIITKKEGYFWLIM